MLDAGWDYPGIGPEHSYLKELGRAEYFAVTDKQALEAFELCSKLEGIIPALETAHAFAYLDVSAGTTSQSYQICRLNGRARQAQKVMRVLRADCFCMVQCSVLCQASPQ